MNYLVFGDKPSLCEANFAMLCTIEDNEEQWPQAAATVRRNIFVDDLYTACTNVPAAIKLRQDVTTLLAKGGFHKLKWLSSSREVLLSVPEAEWVVPTDCLELGELRSGHALGIRCDAQADMLGFALAHLERPPAPSRKRGILSRLSGLYDPLGWASAFVV